ncbi:MAG: universal stress protein, partial [Burkholderiales bacterium]|nr:universal stress protein [Burkholderiales bacterium]
MTEVRRILVALDASPHSQAALRAAAELAAELKAELLGVFVEDINLLRLAALPGAEEVVSALGRARALDPVRLERALRLQAAELRRALESVAAETHVRWAFRVTRGRVVNELLSAAH